MLQKKNKVGICYANKSIIQFRIDIEFGRRNLQEFRKFAEAAVKKRHCKLGFTLCDSELFKNRGAVIESNHLNIFLTVK